MFHFLQGNKGTVYLIPHGELSKLSPYFEKSDGLRYEEKTTHQDQQGQHRLSHQHV
jgi:hypothetical protein